MTDRSNDNTQLSVIPETQARQLRWLLLLAAVFFILGIFFPMITISKFIFIKNSFSVLSGVYELLRNGQIPIFVIVAGFSIVLPIMKIWVLYQLLSTSIKENPMTRRYLHLMHEYGRWSMLDVMVVAVLIVTVKLGAIASIQVHFGLYVFGTSVLLIMLITHKVVRLSSDVVPPAGP
jgi:paraquat-inducible protein A